MDTTQLDTTAFDAPKPKKRNSTSTGIDVQVQATHSIIAKVPHVGANVALPHLIKDINNKIGVEQYVFCFNDHEEDEWQEHGGILTVDLEGIQPDTNRLLCEQFNRSDARYYIHEAHSRRHLEIALLEICTREDIEFYASNTSAFIDSYSISTHLSHAIAVTHTWREILTAWHLAFPGAYYSVSNVWRDNELPWPVEIVSRTPVGDINVESGKDWKQSIKHHGNDRIEVDGRWLGQYIHKVPQYAK
jgi:hypothetical protein